MRASLLIDEEGNNTFSFGVLVWMDKDSFLHKQYLGSARWGAVLDGLAVPTVQLRKATHTDNETDLLADLLKYHCTDAGITDQNFKSIIISLQDKKYNQT